MSEATATAASLQPSEPRRGGLVTAYLTLLRWSLAQMGPMVALVVVVQALLAASILIGFGLLIPGIDTTNARFLSTGAPTVLLLTIGLVMVPQAVAQARTNGTFTYLRALPVPRPLLLLSDLTTWTIVALPAIPVTALVGWLRYDLHFALDRPVLIAAAPLVAITAASVGYAIAVSVQPMLAQVITQVLVFFVLLFSPVTFPADRLPQWYQTVHEYLPVQPGADLLRAGLSSDVYSADGRDLIVLAVWTVLSLVVTLRALARRG